MNPAAVHPDFIRPEEDLPMPRTAGLTEEQLAGETCVWCDVRPREPLPLGIRLSTLRGRLHRWSPIGHRRCAAKEAGRVYALHRRTCARCTPGEYCADAVALYRLSQST